MITIDKMELSALSVDFGSRKSKSQLLKPYDTISVINKIFDDISSEFGNVNGRLNETSSASQLSSEFKKYLMTSDYDNTRTYAPTMSSYINGALEYYVGEIEVGGHWIGTNISDPTITKKYTYKGWVWESSVYQWKSGSGDINYIPSTGKISFDGTAVENKQEIGLNPERGDNFVDMTCGGMRFEFTKQSKQFPNIPTDHLVLSSQLSNLMKTTEAGFEVNGTFFKSLKSALEFLNESTSEENTLKMTNDVNLDDSDYVDGVYNNLPAITKNVTIDLNGKTLTTSMVFSSGGNYNNDANRIFRIQLPYTSEKEGVYPSNIVKIKNGKVRSIVNSVSPSGFLKTTSSQPFEMKDIDIYFDTTSLQRTYANGSTIISISNGNASHATVLSNVRCFVNGKDYDGCFNFRTQVDVYELQLNNCNFTIKDNDMNRNPYNRSYKSVVIGGQKCNLIINGGKFTAIDACATIFTENVGCNISASNAILCYTGKTGIDSGYVLRAEANQDNVTTIDLKNTKIIYPNVSEIYNGSRTDWETTSLAHYPSMIQIYSDGQPTLDTVTIDGGDYTHFSLVKQDKTSMKCLIKGGTFDVNVSTVSGVELEAGKTCTKDSSTGKWVVA